MNVSVVSSTTTIISSDARYYGMSLRDATGDANAIAYKGTAATSGNEVGLAGASDEKQTDHQWIDGGIRCPDGIHVAKTNGDLLLVYWVKE